MTDANQPGPATTGVLDTDIDVTWTTRDEVGGALYGPYTESQARAIVERTQKFASPFDRQVLVRQTTIDQEIDWRNTPPENAPTDAEPEYLTSYWDYTYRLAAEHARMLLERDAAFGGAAPESLRADLNSTISGFIARRDAGGEGQAEDLTGEVLMALVRYSFTVIPRQQEQS